MPGAVSTPDDTSTPGASAVRDGARDILRIKPAGQKPGPGEFAARQQLPVEGRAMTARAVRAPGRLGIEQKHVGRLLIDGHDGEIGNLGDRQRLDHRQAERARISPTRAGVSPPWS